MDHGASSRSPDRPLADIKVVALEQSVAGPLCSRVLGDLGATVIKVERPGGDFSRAWDDHAAGESAQFWWLNRAKRSVELNFRDDADRQTLEALLRSADVVVHNMSPAAADRLALTGDALLWRHPHLISCQISGYGATTSLRDRKAYDMLIQAESGVMSITGTPESPARTGVSISDVSTGIYAALLVLAALYERRTTGKGRVIDVSMLDVTVEFLAPMLLSYVNAGVIYPRMLDQHHAIAPYGVFSSADGRRVLLAVQQDAEWSRLCADFLRQPSLATSERFGTNLARVRGRALVNELVATAFAARSFDQIVQELTSLGLAFAEVRDVAAVASHPGLVERGVLAEVTAASGATVTTYVGLAERAFSAGEPPGRLRPPLVGEDGEYVAQSTAGA